MACEAEKWEIKVSARLRGSSPDQIWPLLQDFFTLHEWLPMIDVCYGVEGVSDQPGCVRYSAVTKISKDGSEEAVTNWALEKLLAIDPINKSFSYEIMDSNMMGFKSLVATTELTHVKDAEKEATAITWSFVANPIGGTEIGLTEFYGSALQRMAERMEAALSTQGA
ncbi:hypothetical protein ACJRO7_016253 [Eucalyptus globulus]|uniref:Lachrymatory factor synthase n=1 Tax=Eucalyptus globulus TaxID=34317 RepID=A0ABD3LA26_EUCGL